MTRVINAIVASFLHVIIQIKKNSFPVALSSPSSTQVQQNVQRIQAILACHSLPSHIAELPSFQDTAPNQESYDTTPLLQTNILTIAQPLRISHP